MPITTTTTTTSDKPVALHRHGGAKWEFLIGDKVISLTPKQKARVQSQIKTLQDYNKHASSFSTSIGSWNRSVEILTGKKSFVEEDSKAYSPLEQIYQSIQSRPNMKETADRVEQLTKENQQLKQNVGRLKQDLLVVQHTIARGKNLVQNLQRAKDTLLSCVSHQRVNFEKQSKQLVQLKKENNEFMQVTQVQGQVLKESEKVLDDQNKVIKKQKQIIAEQKILLKQIKNLQFTNVNLTDRLTSSIQKIEVMDKELDKKENKIRKLLRKVDDHGIDLGLSRKECARNEIERAYLQEQLECMQKWLVDIRDLRQKIEDAKDNVTKLKHLKIYGLLINKTALISRPKDIQRIQEEWKKKGITMKFLKEVERNCIESSEIAFFFRDGKKVQTRFFTQDKQLQTLRKRRR